MWQKRSSAFDTELWTFQPSSCTIVTVQTWISHCENGRSLTSRQVRHCTVRFVSLWIFLFDSTMVRYFMKWSHNCHNANQKPLEKLYATAQWNCSTPKIILFMLCNIYLYFLWPLKWGFAILTIRWKTSRKDLLNREWIKQVGFKSPHWKLGFKI